MPKETYKKPTLAQRSFVEGVGTFFLVFIGVSAIISTQYLAGGNAITQLLIVALAHGFALAIAVTMAMNISGGHINPAVTLGFLATRRISPRDAVAYVAAQLAGATAAGALALQVMPSQLAAISGYGVPAVNSLLTIPQAILAEAAITFLLMISVYGTAVDERAPPIGGFGIGITLAIAIMAVGPFTGAAANPARALGPAIASYTFTNWYVYLIGPIAGAVLAALLYENLILKRRA